MSDSFLNKNTMMSWFKLPYLSSRKSDCKNLGVNEMPAKVLLENFKIFSFVF